TMQTGMEEATGRENILPGQDVGQPEVIKNARLLELRKKIESGFYESKEVLSKIVDKMLNEFKEHKK
ncbi:MAG: hypothetical protein ACREBV_08595, partial [Candidatus Zixiibacteriota bacterium]